LNSRSNVRVMNLTSCAKSNLALGSVHFSEKSQCKWSLAVYQLLANVINRPGEIVRSVEGLTTKVLNECLRKNVAFGILERIAFHEVPPHTR
jgi:DNA-binding HxlR family transcriptional regulator